MAIPKIPWKYSCGINLLRTLFSEQQLPYQVEDLRFKQDTNTTKNWIQKMKMW